MRMFLRQLVLTSLVGAVALTALDGKIVLAAPGGPKASVIEKITQWLRGVARPIEESEGFPAVRDKVEQAINKAGKIFQPNREAPGASRPVEKEAEKEAAHLRLAERTKAEVEEAEAARRRQTETQHEVSALYEAIRSDSNLEKQIQQIIEAQERIEIKMNATQNMLNEAVAKLARVEASRPDHKFEFDAQTGSLTKTWVKRGIKFTVGIPLYPPLEHAGEYVYRCMVVEQNTAEKCIKNVVESVREYIETKLTLPDEALVGPGPVNVVVPLTPIEFRSL